ncbi:rod-binding protein [Sphingobium sp. B2]|uniref:rod-binding protein n=1 Tax=Sphingobium sp. B2 TaxID=2583228 RepID=UPI0011A0BFEF|nr:rod-binding protein [Sphingobium sp. B2]
MQISATSSATAPSGATPANKASLEKTAQQFEAIFLRQMIGAMRSASLAEGISDSSATEQFQSMADSRTADAMASGNSLGIAQLLIKQFGAKPAPDALAGTTAP